MVSHNITELLLEWKNGDKTALEKLYPIVERELRHIASTRIRKEKKNHILQTTALINEALLKLAKGNVEWQDRAHFYAVSARIMRNVLINYARDLNAAKRGRGVTHLNFDEVTVISRERSQEIIDLDEALERLALRSKIKADVVELRYFGGMSIEETAEVLGISPSSVSAHWRFARAWLGRELRNGSS